MFIEWSTSFCFASHSLLHHPLRSAVGAASSTFPSSSSHYIIDHRHLVVRRPLSFHSSHSISGWRHLSPLLFSTAPASSHSHQQQTCPYAQDSCHSSSSSSSTITVLFRTRAIQAHLLGDTKAESEDMNRDMVSAAIPGVDNLKKCPENTYKLPLLRTDASRGRKEVEGIAGITRHCFCK